MNDFTIIHRGLLQLTLRCHFWSIFGTNLANLAYKIGIYATNLVPIWCQFGVNFGANLVSILIKNTEFDHFYIEKRIFDILAILAKMAILAIFAFLAFLTFFVGRLYDGFCRIFQKWRFGHF